MGECVVPLARVLLTDSTGFRRSYTPWPGIRRFIGPC